MRVLLVENNDDIADLITRLFAGVGIETCSVAYNARTALLEAEKYAPDVVVLDQFLDGTETGIDLAPKLKARFPTVKILIHSGFDVSLEAASEPSVDAYLAKGRLTELLDAVQDLAGVP